MTYKRARIFGLLFLLFPHLSLASWEGQCVTTADLVSKNPQVVSTPILYWKAKVEKEIGVVMVKLPDTQELLINLVECTKAEIREHQPGDNASIRSQDDGSPGTCVPLGNFWVPLADINEQDDNSRSLNFNLDHPTEYFASQISHHLQDYADSMKWDPLLSSAMSSVDQLFLGAVGFSIWSLSTYHYVPKTFWQRARRRGAQGIGILLMIRQAYSAATGARSQFVEERNQRSAHIETLIQQIDERMTMRLDGQDRGQNLEESDGYSALVNSISRANHDAFEKFCNN